MARFNFTFQPGVSLAQMVGFEMAGQIWSRYFKDDIVINIHVALTDALPGTVIGGAIPTYVDTNVNAIQFALRQDSTSSEDAIATRNLNVQIGDDGVLQYSGLVGEHTQQSSQMTLTQANAKAVGVTTPEDSGANPDGYIVLNSLQSSRYDWNDDYARTAPATNASLDFLSVALHEIGHIMGFTSGVDSMDSALSQTTLLDLYRYSDRSLIDSVQELTVGEAAYFSIDGGQTNLAAFSTGIVEVMWGIEGYQASHWANNVFAQPIVQPAAIETTPVAGSTTDLSMNVVTRLFEFAAPVSAADQVDDISQLLREPDSQSLAVVVDETGAGRFSLGIMDPALAPGERSQITELDLLAMDVLGYDLTQASLDINYQMLLAEAEAAIAQALGISVEDLNADVDTSPLTQDRWQEVLSAMNASDEVYERRRAKRSKSSTSYWQEDDLDPTVLNIISDGAGDESEIFTNDFSRWITTVEALPPAPLILRTANLVGNDANELMIPLFDQYQAIAAGNGDNVVQLGKQGSFVTAGSGHDTIMAMGGTVVIDAGEGDNVIVLDDQQAGQRTVTTGSGHDYINITGTLVTVNSGAGNDVVAITSTNTLSSRGTFTVTDMAGDNTIQLDGEYTQQTVTTGDGNDRIDVQGSSATINSGAGNDAIVARTSDASQHSDFEITALGGDNFINVESIDSRITTGDGHDTILFTGVWTELSAGDGNDIIIGRTSDASDYSDFEITALGGDNFINFESIDSLITTGDGHDTILFTGVWTELSAGDGNDIIIGENLDTSYTDSDHTYTIDATGGDNFIQLKGSDRQLIYVTTGDGSDTIDVQGSSATITTGAGIDTVILGDRHQAYYTGNGTYDYAHIMDFSSTDVLQLHGTADDYGLTNRKLFYQGDAIATFYDSSNFTLDSDQVYFVNSTTPEPDVPDITVPDVPDITVPDVPDITVPTVNEILNRVQTYHTTLEDPTYSIIGGDDAQFFTIDPYTGDLWWKTVPDVTSPLDANGDNKYDVLVQATLGDGNTGQDIDTQRLTIINDGTSIFTPVSSDSSDETGGDRTVSSITVESDSTGTASISGQVRNDGDGDGDLTDLDGGITGVTLKLFEDNDRDSQKDGQSIAETTTDANGYYSFTDLADGNYIVRQIDLDGFISTADVDGGRKGQIWSLTINGDNAFTNQDFLDASTTGPWTVGQT